MESAHSLVSRRACFATMPKQVVIHSLCPFLEVWDLFSLLPVNKQTESTIKEAFKGYNWSRYGFSTYESMRDAFVKKVRNAVDAMGIFFPISSSIRGFRKMVGISIRFYLSYTDSDQDSPKNGFFALFFTIPSTQSKEEGLKILFNLCPISELSKRKALCAALINLELAMGSLAPLLTLNDRLIKNLMDIMDCHDLDHFNKKIGIIGNLLERPDVTEVELLAAIRFVPCYLMMVGEPQEIYAHQALSIFKRVGDRSKILSEEYRGILLLRLLRFKFNIEIYRKSRHKFKPKEEITLIAETILSMGPIPLEYQSRAHSIAKEENLVKLEGLLKPKSKICLIQ